MSTKTLKLIFVLNKCARPPVKIILKFFLVIFEILKIISKISKITKKNFKIILTGGLAHLFKTNIRSNVLVDKNLTIKGLIKAHKILNK